MSQLVHLVVLVFVRKWFEWLLFLLFEVLLVECVIYTTGHVGFHQMYSAVLWKAIFVCIVIYSILMGTSGHTGQ